MSDAVYLSSLVVNLRCRESRRDLADCMAMHRTLMSAFPDRLSSDGAARSEAGVLYRVEPTDGGDVRVLVQSAASPDWLRLPLGWCHPEAGFHIKEITQALDRVEAGSLLRFKLLANPTRKIGTKTGPDGRKNNGKRVELRSESDWLAWLERKAGQSGFRLKVVRASPHVPDVQSGRDLRTTGYKRAPDGSACRLTFCGVLFEGRLEVIDAEAFNLALRTGIGPGKAYGYGLLSLAPGG